MRRSRRRTAEIPGATLRDTSARPTPSGRPWCALCTWKTKDVTLTSYSHAFARRDAAPLGEQLAAFMRKESAGCELVARGGDAAQPHTEVIESMVARGGIEPPTRGFSIRQNLHPA